MYYAEPYIVMKEPDIVVKDQQSLKNFLIHEISNDFDIIDYFFSNPYKCAAILPELKPLYYKDVKAHKENSSQSPFIKNSSKDNLEENASVSSEILYLPKEESLVIGGGNVRLKC